MKQGDYIFKKNIPLDVPFEIAQSLLKKSSIKFLTSPVTALSTENFAPIIPKQRKRRSHE